MGLGGGDVHPQTFCPEWVLRYFMWVIWRLEPASLNSVNLTQTARLWLPNTGGSPPVMLSSPKVSYGGKRLKKSPQIISEYLKKLWRLLNSRWGNQKECPWIPSSIERDVSWDPRQKLCIISAKVGLFLPVVPWSLHNVLIMQNTKNVKEPWR